MQKKLFLLHDALMEILRPLMNAGSASVKVDEERNHIRNWFLVLLSCCGDIHERKHLSCVTHVIAVTTLNVRCILTMGYILDLRESDKRQLEIYHACERRIRLIDGKGLEDG